MASRQVLKLCEKIKNDCGIVCKPDTFHVERENQSFYVWYMEVDVEASTGFSERALEVIGYPTCVSSWYMKDLLKEEKLTKVVNLDDSEVIIKPKY